jgi:hypothetical protein
MASKRDLWVVVVSLRSVLDAVCSTDFIEKPARSRRAILLSSVEKINAHWTVVLSSEEYLLKMQFESF